VTNGERHFKFTGTNINWGMYGNSTAMGLYDWQNSRNIMAYAVATGSLNIGVPVLQHNGSTIWTSGNDGTNSGLDADLLDGVHGNQFLRKDISDTMTGNLTIVNAGNALSLKKTAAYIGNLWMNFRDVNNTEIGWLGYGSGTVDVFSITNQLGDIVLSPGSGIAKVGANLIWTAGNDGAGSGLDSDLLDGLQGSSYMRTDTNTSTSGNITVGGIIKCGKTAWRATFNPGEIRKTIAHNIGVTTYVTTTGTNSSARHANWENPTATTIDIVLDSPYYDGTILVDVIMMGY
jgi:hypothetical protein